MSTDIREGKVAKLMATEQELEETKSKLAMITTYKNLSFTLKSPESFVHTWKIESWSQKMLNIKAGVEKYYESNPFYVPPGYHLHLHAYLDYNASSHLGVFLCPQKGDFDDSVQWSFSFSFTLELLDQQPNGKNISRKYSLSYGDKALVNPAISTGGYGSARLASHKTLETLCYIKDNAIVIKVTVHLTRRV